MKLKVDSVREQLRWCDFLLHAGDKRKTSDGRRAAGTGGETVQNNGGLDDNR